ncbi:18667_t:CDS:1, partial [Gigaspora rosea]
DPRETKFEKSLLSFYSKQKYTYNYFIELPDYIEYQDDIDTTSEFGSFLLLNGSKRSTDVIENVDHIIKELQNNVNDQKIIKNFFGQNHKRANRSNDLGMLINTMRLFYMKKLDEQIYDTEQYVLNILSNDFIEYHYPTDFILFLLARAIVNSSQAKNLFSKIVIERCLKRYDKTEFVTDIAYRIVACRLLDIPKEHPFIITQKSILKNRQGLDGFWELEGMYSAPHSEKNLYVGSK